MRFRTRIANVGLMHKIVRSLAALAKVCVIRLNIESIHFIVPGNEGRDGVQVWSSVKVPTLFDHYRIESNTDNEIWLELNLDALLKVLKSADTSSGSGDGMRANASALTDADVTLKLNKRDNRAIWAFEIKGQSIGGNRMNITHEVTVHILGSRRQNDLSEPLCPPPDIHLVLPDLAELKNIVSRLSHVAEDVTISADHTGKMELRVKSDHVQTATTWNNLRIPSTTGNEASQTAPVDQLFSATVSIRGLQKFLTSHHVGGVGIACVCDNHCLIAYVYIGDMDDAGGVLTFFIPAKTVD